MSEAPERIWAYAGAFKMWRAAFPEHAKSADPTEYIRKDVSDALVAAAREKALREAADLADELAIEMEEYHAIPTTTTKSKALCIRNRILALITKDADNG